VPVAGQADADELATSRPPFHVEIPLTSAGCLPGV